MRSMIAAVLAVSTLACPAARAAAPETLQTGAFSLQVLYDMWESQGAWGDIQSSLSVLSTDTSSTVIGLGGMAETLTEWHSLGSVGRGNANYSAFRFQAAEGYRITSIRLSATISGEFTQPEMPADAVNIQWGGTWNSVNMRGSLTPGEIPAWTVPTRAELTQVESPVVLGFELDNSANLDEFVWSMNVSVAAQGTRTTYSLPDNPRWPITGPLATASIYLSNPTLTVYTELLPVPEPGQWAMLAGGLLLLGGMRARRRCN